MCNIDWDKLMVGVPGEDIIPLKIVQEYLALDDREEALSTIAYATKKWGYRPIPFKSREAILAMYLSGMNGFGYRQRRPLTIEGFTIADDYHRVVVGDYGAYVEIHPNQLTAELAVKAGQEWRLDDAYIAKRGLHVKYHWFVLMGMQKEVKVYYQLDTVRYADYKPGFYYISVLDFDPL